MAISIATPIGQYWPCLCLQQPTTIEMCKPSCNCIPPYGRAVSEIILRRGGKRCKHSHGACAFLFSTSPTNIDLSRPTPTSSTHHRTWLQKRLESRLPRSALLPPYSKPQKVSATPSTLLVPPFRSEQDRNPHSLRVPTGHVGEAGHSRLAPREPGRDGPPCAIIQRTQGMPRPDQVDTRPGAASSVRLPSSRLTRIQAHRCSVVRSTNITNGSSKPTTADHTKESRR